MMDPLLESSESESEENDIMCDFVRAYESLPVLWDPAHEHYLNKTKRSEALRQLLRIYRKIHPHATTNTVKAKINSMRTNYRKELKKIKTSRRLGSSTSECYKPASWYFYALDFLKKLETPTSEKSMSENDEKTPPSQAAKKSIKIKSNLKREAPTEELSVPTTLLSFSPTQPAHHTLAPSNKKYRSTDLITRQNDLLQQLSTYMERATPAQDQVPIAMPTIAKAWGEQLVALDAQQRIFAEKAINDILFEASLGTLHRNSIQINVDVAHTTQYLDDDDDPIIHDPMHD